MPTPPRPSRFPLKTALAIATIAAALTLWHWRIGSGSSIYPSGLNWHNLAGVAKLQLFPHRQPSGPKIPEPNVQGSGTPEAPIDQPPDALLIDNAGTLDHFYESLAALDHHAAAASATVVHFGDSPTTADLITGDVRQQLQKRFGDAGQGFNLIAKPWAWYGHRDIDETDRGWKWNTGVGVMREGQYGIGGAEFDGGRDAYTRYKLSGSQQNTIQIIWRSAPDGGSFTVSADGNVIATIDTAIDTANPVVDAPALTIAQADAAPTAPAPIPATTPAPVATSLPPHHYQTVPLPAATRVVELHVTQGSVRLYGVVFHRDGPGLVYDSIGLNGASVTVLSRALAKDMMKTNFAHLHPDLIVINYGTNEAGFASFIGKQYEGELRTAIARVHEAAPGASILLMSPMDRGERGGGSGIATMATIPRIVAMQQRVAADTGCAFFNTFQAMGGDGTMQRWYEGKPRLVGGDLIHPTPQGAKIVATAFVDQLLQGYARYAAGTFRKTAAITSRAQ